MTTKVKHDAVSELLANQIEAGIAQINTANEVLLAEESGTSVRDIDKALKAEAERVSKEEGYVTEFPESVVKNFAEAQAAYDIYRKALDEARNVYRVEVLGEEAKATSSLSEEEKNGLKDVRKVVMDAITFLKSYATGNGKKDLIEYADSIQVPQVGRQGVSSVGVKKPRVFVKIGETVYDSFSLAAAALSTKDVKVTAGDLAQAWNDAGGTEGDFTFGENTLNITFKPKASESK